MIKSAERFWLVGNRVAVDAVDFLLATRLSTPLRPSAYTIFRKPSRAGR